MFHLPVEIQRIIYSFDSTERDNYFYVLELLMFNDCMKTIRNSIRDITIKASHYPNVMMLQILKMRVIEEHKQNMRTVIKVHKMRTENR